MPPLTRLIDISIHSMSRNGKGPPGPSRLPLVGIASRCPQCPSCVCLPTFAQTRTQQRRFETNPHIGDQYDNASFKLSPVFQIPIIGNFVQRKRPLSTADSTGPQALSITACLCENSHIVTRVDASPTRPLELSRRRALTSRLIGARQRVRVN